MRSWFLALVCAAVVIGVLAACARRIPPVATASDAERARVPLVELEQGRKLVLGKCTRCHETPLPRDHTPNEWPQMIGEMAERSKLDLAERSAIEQYLVAMAATR